MNGLVRRRLMCAFAATTLCCGTLYAASSNELLQQALYAEQIEGNLPAAIASYEQVVNDADASSKQVAQALYREGLCYLQLEQDEKALIALTRLVSEFSEQTELVKQVQPILDKLDLFDPATLMPSETLAYFEMGDIGGQVETIFEMLKGTPLEDPLQAIAQNNPEMLSSGAGPIMAGLLNSAMKEEFLKIRGLAVGVTDINSSAPGGVGVVNLGESTMLRGLLMTALSMAGTPGPTIEGLATYTIQDQIALACDNTVFLFATKPDLLPEMIKKYENPSATPSLASKYPGFALGRGVRGKNLATLWVDVDTLYHQVMPEEAGPRETFGPAPLISESVLGIDELLMSASFSTNAVTLDAQFKMKDGTTNPIYEMFRTPSIGANGLKGIPANAVGLLSFNLPASDSAAMMQLQQLVQENVNLNLPSELIDSLGQITLFTLPYENMAEPHVDLAGHPGMVIECSDPSLVIPFVETFKPMLAEEQIVVEVVDKAIVVSVMDSTVLDAVKATLAGAPSVVEAGALKGPVGNYVDSSEKLALINVAGLARMVGSDNMYELPSPVVTEEMNQRVASRYEDLAEVFQSANLSLYTKEQDQNLHLQLKLDGIPKAADIITAVRGIMEVEAAYNEKFLELQQQKAAERALRDQEARLARLAELVPAKVARTSTAPAIDGELDDAWKQATVYDVEKVNSGIVDIEQGDPIEGCELAADFRMLWDDQHLYVFMDITDSTLNRNPELSWQFSDNAILYIDALDTKREEFGSRDYEYAFCWDAEEPVMREPKHENTGNVVYTLKTTDKGYAVEAAFPWATLGTPSPSDGTTIGIDVQVSDNQAGPQRNLMIGWQDDTNGAWQYPVLFGQAILEGDNN